MAKRKYKKRKTNKKATYKNVNVKGDIAVVMIIAIGILLSVLIYFKSGLLGEKVSKYAGQAFGWVKYIIPIGTIATGISLMYERKKKTKLKVTQYILFLISFSILLSLYQISVENINISQGFAKVMQRATYLGENGRGGGIIGVACSMGLIKLIGVLGAVILAMAVLVVNFIFLFKIKLTEKFVEIANEFNEKKEELAEEYAQSREAKRAARAKKMEEEKALKEQAKQQEKLDKEALKLQKEKEATEVNEQLTININGKKDIMNVKENQEEPEIISNLFKQEEQKKEEKVKEILTLEHTITIEDEHYEFPSLELLKRGELRGIKGGKKAVTETASRLQKTLYSFGVSAKVENVSVGPAITRYELKPAEGVRVSKIANLADDIALNLAAETIRIEAPIPGKQAVGIEVPNKENEVVHIRDIIESDSFTKNKSKLAFALGKDVAGQEVVTDIAKMPHVLIAGATGSGKSVCINTLLASIIYKAKPSEVKLVMIDPKVVELSVYNGIPHLLIPVVTDTRKAAGALAWAVQEMVNRYSLFASKNVRDIKGYNEVLDKEGGMEKLPQIVIIIDELSDLMMVSPKEVEDSICRLAQMARAAGMHLVIATQRPSVDVITGIIKANIPSRISFAVSSQVDSRTILDMVGAEKLLGKGDMLFYPAGAPKPVRVQGAFISDKEVENIVDFVKSNGEVNYSTDILNSIENSNNKSEAKDELEEDDTDEFLMDAIDLAVETRTASTSFIQRRFKVGYARAGRIIDQMEERGIVSGYQGSKPREVLVSKEQLAELKMAWESLKKAAKSGGEVAEDK